MQERYALVKTEGDVSYYSVQFRINFDDEIFCKDADCEGYVFAFGYPTLDNETNVYHHVKMLNSFKGIYTMPDLMPIKSSWDSGAKRYLVLNKGFVYTNPGSTNENRANMFYSCVDNKLKSSGKCRCDINTGYRKIYDPSKAKELE